MIRGILLGLGASASWAMANVAIQRSGRTLGPFRSLLWAQVAVLPGIVLLSVLFERHETADASMALWIAIAGASALLAYVPLFYALEKGKLAVVVPIASSWSMISTALAAASGEPIRASQLLGTLLVLGGIVLVTRPPPAADARRDHAERRAVLAAIVAALGFGIMVPALGKLTPRIGSMGATAASYGVELLLGVPLAVAFRVSLAPPRGADWWPAALTGGLETVGFICVGLATLFAPLAVVGPAASLAPGMTVLYAWLVLADRPPRLAALGAILASCGVVVLGL